MKTTPNTQNTSRHCEDALKGYSGGRRSNPLSPNANGLPHCTSLLRSQWQTHSRGWQYYYRSSHGFTLVELIVVITILVILGTIAFTQLGSFAGSARDSARISNLTNLKKWLDLFQIKSGSYPMPKDAVTITASGVIIGYQGFAKDQIADIAKLSPWGTQDPSDPTIFTTYAVDQTRSKMQAMVFLEDNSTLTTFVPNASSLWITQASASTTSDYSKRYPTTIGNGLGILVDSSTGSTKNQPIQELYNTTAFTGVDIARTASGYRAYFSVSDTLEGTGSILQALQISYTSGAGYGSPSSCPTGFIAVPGNKDDFKQLGFCVAKYEMSYDETTLADVTGWTEWNTRKYNSAKTPVSMAGRLPITELTQQQAIDSCKKLGAGYHLITNNEWMTIARNIEANPTNWSTGITGSGYISNGVSNDATLGCGTTNTKTQYPNAFTWLAGTYLWGTTTGEWEGNTTCDTKRQLTLSNNQTIWDLSGNVWEHMNGENSINPTGTGYANQAGNVCGAQTDNNWNSFTYNAITDTIRQCNFTNGYTYATIGPKTPNLNAFNGIGRIWSYGTSSPTNRVFVRGGGGNSGAYSGVFALRLDWVASTALWFVGFRCAR